MLHEGTEVEYNTLHLQSYCHHELNSRSQNCCVGCHMHKQSFYDALGLVSGKVVL